jgi:aconitate hydratase
MVASDPFDAVRSFEHEGVEYRMADLRALEDAGLCELSSLPVSVRVLLEAVLRNAVTPGGDVTAEDVRTVAGWAPDVPDGELPFQPSRVVLQDLTGVPAVVDLAAGASRTTHPGTTLTKNSCMCSKIIRRVTRWTTRCAGPICVSKRFGNCCRMTMR